MIVLGLLIDDSFVVIENITRTLRGSGTGEGGHPGHVPDRRGGCSGAPPPWSSRSCCSCSCRAAPATSSAAFRSRFGSFRGTLVVASVIPLGLFGGLVLLCLTGYTLSFTALVGFVALVGIEIKNSTLPVDFTNQLRDAGEPLEAAIQKADEVRFSADLPDQT